MANFHVIAGADEVPAKLTIRKIHIADIREALSRGVDDFLAMPSHLAFLGLVYPVFGVCLAALTFSQNALPLVYPLATGFALVGPFAAIGLYEISRRRERGMETSGAMRSMCCARPPFPRSSRSALLLMVIFVAWLATARALYEALFGVLAPDSYVGFLTRC